MGNIKLKICLCTHFVHQIECQFEIRRHILSEMGERNYLYIYICMCRKSSINFVEMITAIQFSFRRLNIKRVHFQDESFFNGEQISNRNKRRTSDQQLYKLLNFKQNNSDFRVDPRIIIDSCLASSGNNNRNVIEWAHQSRFIQNHNAPSDPHFRKTFSKLPPKLPVYTWNENRAETQITDTFSCIRQLGLDWNNVMSLTVGRHRIIWEYLGISNEFEKFGASSKPVGDIAG